MERSRLRECSVCGIWCVVYGVWYMVCVCVCVYVGVMCVWYVHIWCVVFVIC